MGIISNYYTKGTDLYLLMFLSTEGVLPCIDKLLSSEGLLRQDLDQFLSSEDMLLQELDTPHRSSEEMLLQELDTPHRSSEDMLLQELKKHLTAVTIGKKS
jgi:hypothetical protein